MGIQGLEALKPDTTDPDLEEENRNSHIVGPLYTDEGKIEGRTRIMEAMINGTPVTALCGYTWVPTRNPDNYPLCPMCEAIVKRNAD